MDENELTGWVNSLLHKSPPKLSFLRPLLTYLSLGVAFFLLGSGLILLAINLVAPLFRVNSATFSEAMGLMLVWAMVVGTVYLLKESKE